MTKEDNLQISVANYLRLQYPKVLFFHVANERQTSPKRGAKLKKMGVKSGIPDILVIEPKIMSSDQCTNYHCSGLCIELKVKPNKPTKNQLEVLSQFSSRGWQTHICYSFEETKQLIDNYLE